MVRLMMVLYAVIGTAMAGAGVIVVLTMGLASLQPILLAAATGAVLALPVSWTIAKTLA